MSGRIDRPKLRASITSSALSAGFILAAILLLVPHDSAQAQTPPTLKFLNDPVKLTLGEHKHGTTERCPPQSDKDVSTTTANATVFVLLSGSDRVLDNLTFQAKVKPEKGKWGNEPSRDEVAQSRIDTCWAALKGNMLGDVDSRGDNEIKSTIGASEIKPFVIFVEGHTPAKSYWWWVWYFFRPSGIPIDEANLSGQLIVKDASDTETVQGTLPLRLSNVAPGYERGWFYTILGLSLGTFVLAAWSIYTGAKGVQRTEKREIQFKDRWAANLTGVGAVLGTLLSAGVLPNDTFFLSKQQYLALNVLFGLVILLATVKSNIVGTARAFWLTSAATVAAGVGEVITVLFMLKEMQLQGSMPWGGVFATQIAIILASPFILFFARKNVIEEIGKFSVISVTSEAFKEDDEIPLRYTCDGLDVSPPLKWSLVPNGTQTLALIVDDPDDSRGTFVHWVIYNMPKGTTGLPEDASNQPLPEGAVQGVNGTGKVGYRGPCPHSGSHRYFFKVYALNTKLDFDGGATGERLLHAMENHILAEGHLMGTYPGS